MARDRPPRRRTVLVTLTILLLASGACALVYQQLWFRLLSLVFGVTVYAASTVLATFFAGLALGSYVAARYADRTTRPLWWYGWAEILIGLAALVTSAALRGVAALYELVHDPLPDSVAALTVVRVVLTFLALLIPATLMGATLPLAIKAATSGAARLDERVGLLYATNTLGAVLGTLLAGWWLIGNVGLTFSFRAGAAVNVTIGVVAIGCSRVWERGVVTSSAEPPSHRVPARSIVSSTRERTRIVVLIVFTVSGFVALALEIVWFRVLVLHVNATSRAFAVMLATVLVGIALGSYLVTPLMRRRADWLWVLAVVEAALAITSLLSLYLLSRSYVFVDGPTAGSSRFLVLASVFAVLPATLLMGVAFPIGVRLWATGPGSRGDDSTRDVGVLYSLNVVGGIAGSLVAGFVMVPVLGARTSIVVLSGMALAGALARRRAASSSCASARAHARRHRVVRIDRDACRARPVRVRGRAPVPR